MLPEIEREMAFTHGGAAAIFLFLTCGYFLSILLSGFVSSRLGHKRTIVTSSGGCGVVLLVIGLCESLNELRFAVFLLGAGVMPTCIGVVGDYATLGAGITATGCITMLVAILAIWQARRNYSPKN
ncbi:MAG: hypothetical protein ACWGOX_10825 [Desulforhopalus sp.]